jgi:hypothetical protein
LWLLGGALAGLTAPFAAWRVSVAASLGFAAVAAGLLLLAWGTLRRARWAMLVSMVGCAGQLLGVVGSAWELIYPTDTAKSRELQTLGVDPVLAFTVNLACARTSPFPAVAHTVDRHWTETRAHMLLCHTRSWGGA